MINRDEEMSRTIATNSANISITKQSEKDINEPKTKVKFNINQ